MDARLVLEDVPGAFTTITHAGRRVRVRMDPMWLGSEKLRGLEHHPRMVWQLVDESDRMRVMMPDPFGAKVAELLRAYADGVGLGVRGLQALWRGLDELDALEVDLVRIGVEVRDWLDPEGPVSSRRMALIIQDLIARPETSLGARAAGLFPLDKAAMAAAQIATGLSDKKGFVHPFLRKVSDLEAEAVAQAEAEVRRERIRHRRLVVEHVERTEVSFESARDESRRELEKILASREAD